MARPAITTDRQLAALKAEAKPYEVGVAKARGLIVRVFPSGRKMFELRYVALNGKRRRLPLGDYGDVSLADAGDLASAHRVSVRDGKDPAAERIAERTRARTGDTLDELADAYFLAAAKGLHGGRGRPKRASTIAVEKARVAKHIKPKLGGTRFAEIGRSQVRQFMRELASGELAADTVASVGRTLSAIMAFAVHEERLDANPVTGLSQPLALRQRDRMFSLETMRVLWAALEDAETAAEPVTRLALQLAMLTLTRRADVAGASWGEFDRSAKTWTIPAGRHKSRRPHVVPLNDDTMALLKRAAQHAFGEKAEWGARPAAFVFPSPTLQDRHVTEHGLTRALARILKNLELPPGSPHDFRRTGGTTLTGEGANVRRFIVSKVLGHAAHEGAAVTAVYDRNEYLPDKRRTLALWSDMLLRPRSEDDERVVSISTA